MRQVLPIQESYRANKRHVRMITLLLCSILIMLALLSLMLGHKTYTFIEVFQTLFQKDTDFTMHLLRLPRMLNGIFCGFAFGIAGNTFQKLLGNPLASPDIIGVSAGASIGAIFCILVLQLSGAIVSIAAIISGLLVAGTLFLLSKKGHFSSMRLILIGIGAQAFLNAFISFLLLKAAQYDVASALRWLSGSLNQVTIEQAGLLGVSVILLGTLLLLMSRYLQILELGDAFATTLGVNITVVKVILFVSALLLVAFATAVSGPIASVAFLSGPIASKLCKGDSVSGLHAGLVGAILVLGANLLAQNAFDARYPVGVITGLLGAPYLLYLLLQLNKKGALS